jgi:hypothetical protein
MQENPDLYIEVIGYTDSKSSAAFNQQLSEQRAKSVINYIIKKGISSQRFVAVGKGENDPIAINSNPDGTDNPEGRKLNRRVEIKLMNYNGDRIIVEKIKVPKKLIYQNQASSIFLTVSDQPLEKSYFEERFKSETLLEKLKSLKSKAFDGKIAYYLVDYASKAEALQDLNNLLDQGFKDAQIVEKIESETVEVVAVKQTGEFTIQIKALKQKVDPKTFTQLDNVEVYKGKDGFFRYAYGSFNTREEALNEKKRIEKDEAVADAFIVLIKKLKKY